MCLFIAPALPYAAGNSLLGQSHSCMQLCVRAGPRASEGPTPGTDCRPHRRGGFWDPGGRRGGSRRTQQEVPQAGGCRALRRGPKEVSLLHLTPSWLQGLWVCVTGDSHSIGCCPAQPHGNIRKRRLSPGSSLPSSAGSASLIDASSGMKAVGAGSMAMK